MPLGLGWGHTGAHPMSKVHTLADLLQWGCLRPPLYRWCSPLRLRSSYMECWPPAVGNTSSFEHTTLSVPCYKWAESSFIYWYSLYTQFAMVTHIDRVTVLHCLLKFGCQENVIHFCAALSKRNWSLYDFWSQVPGGHAMPADGTAGWQVDGIMVDWLLSTFHGFHIGHQFLFVPGLLLSKCSVYKFATMGLTRDPIAACSTCSWNWPWKEK